MAPQDILGHAKQGNPNAIAALLNRSLHAHGITVEAELRDGCLHVLLESNQVPDQQALIALIQSVIVGLGAESIDTVQVYGCQVGVKAPVWSQEIPLSTSTALTRPLGSTARQKTSPLLQKNKLNRRQKAVASKRRKLAISSLSFGNPFIYLKARSLVGWTILILLLLIVCLAIADFIGFNIEDPIVDPIGYSMTFGLLCFWAWRRCKQLQINAKYIIGKLSRSQQWLPTVGLVVALFLFSLGAFQVSYYFLSFIAPSFVEAAINQKIFRPPSPTSVPLLYKFYKLLAVITEVVVTPVTQEFLFRGILLHRWTAKWGIRTAILASSVAFGVFYLYRNFIGSFVFGLVMTLLYVKTHTLIVPIICHALSNAIVILLEVVSINPGSTRTIYSLEQFRSEWWMGVFYIVLSAPWLILYVYKNWPSKRASAPYFANAPK